MGKKIKRKNKNIIQTPKYEKSNKTLSNSLIKTYSIIAVLIIVYFMTTFSYKSVDKKMDTLANVDTTISNKLNLQNNLLLLSSSDNFLGLTDCSSLPLGRLSIKSSTHKSFNLESPNIITYTFTDNGVNTLIIAGKKDKYKQVIFSDIIESNGNSVSNDITLDIPDEDYFIISAEYKDSYENIRVVNDDDSHIKINE